MRASIVATLSLAAAVVSGCASATRAPESARSPGLHAGGECLGAALMMLKGGLLMVPVSAGIAVLCVPIAVIHEVAPPAARISDGTGAPDFAYPSTSSFGGCPDGRCGIGSDVNGGRTWSGFYPNSYWGQYRRY